MALPCDTLCSVLKLAQSENAAVKLSLVYTLCGNKAKIKSPIKVENVNVADLML